MATKTATTSGNWSAAGTWDAGVPVDNDVVIINAGVSVLMNADQSAFPNGIAGLTINGSDTVPGMLYFANGTDGYLKIKTGTTISGSTGSVTYHGRILANSDGNWATSTPLQFSNKAIIELAGTAQMDCLHLQVRLFCTEPTNKFVEIFGSTYTVNSVDTVNNSMTLSGSPGWTTGRTVRFKSTGTLPAPLEEKCAYFIIAGTTGTTLKISPLSGGASIDFTDAGSGTITVYSYVNSALATFYTLQDVSGDTPWVTTDGHDYCVLASAGAGSNDVQTVQLNSISSTQITVSANTDSVQFALSRLYLVSRNVSIRTTTTSTTTICITSIDYCIFNCEFRSTAGIYGVAYSNVTNSTIGGTVYAYTGVTYSGSNVEYTHDNTITAQFLGTAHSIGGCNMDISGDMVGAGYGLRMIFNSTISGTIFGCQTPLTQAVDCIMSGDIYGGTYGLGGSQRTIFTGDINNSYYLFNGGCDNEVWGKVTSVAIIAWAGVNNTIYGPMKQISNYLRGIAVYQSVNLINPNVDDMTITRNFQPESGRLRCENIGRVAGTHKILDAWGDIVKTACTGVGDAPSQDPDGGSGFCVEASNIQSGCTSWRNKLRIIEKQKIWLSAGARTLTYKVQTTYAGISAGGLKITAKYIDSTGKITSTDSAPAISQRASASDWTQELELSFTTGQEGWAEVCIDLMEYEAGNEVYIWPMPVVA